MSIFAGAPCACTGLGENRHLARDDALRSQLLASHECSPVRSVNTEAQPFLRLSDIRKVYPGVVALAGFDLQVRPGEVIGIVGENGAGKSTLMKILGGVIAPDSGTIEVDGVPSQSFTRRPSRSAPASRSSTRNSTSSIISTSPPMSSSAASHANTAFSTSSTPSGSVPPWRRSCAGSAPISARKHPCATCRSRSSRSSRSPRR